MSRVVLIEDFQLVRAGLRLLVETIPGVSVVGEGANGHEALELIARTKPDVVLMDISMPRLNGIEATRRAMELRPRPRILILSVHLDPAYLQEALAAGAAGYVTKTIDRDELAQALDAVARGRTWITPAFGQSAIDDVLRRQKSAKREVEQRLTGRQREVLQLIAEGQSTRQIAKRLRVSVKTVETHRSHIMQRLDVYTVAGLVRQAIRLRLVPAERQE